MALSLGLNMAEQLVQTSLNHVRRKLLGLAQPRTEATDASPVRVDGPVSANPWEGSSSHAAQLMVFGFAEYSVGHLSKYTVLRAYRIPETLDL